MEAKIRKIQELKKEKNAVIITIMYRTRYRISLIM